MTTIQSLSKEVLIAAFIFLDSIESIGECRLAYKHWSDITTVAMFKKPLHLCFYDKVKAKKLIQYLTKNQNKGQHVKYLSLCDYDNDILETIIPLLFTPNIRELGGDGRDMLYECIARIAHESPVKFDKLKVIPSTDYFTDIYSEALWIFKNSLTALHKFKNLTRLALKAPLENEAELERIIVGCLQLQQLQLNTEANVQYGNALIDTTTLSTRQIENDNMHQVNSLKLLGIASGGLPHFVQYLMFKHPNVQSISLNIQETDAYITKNTEQLIDSLKMAANYSLTYRITAGDTISTVFDAAKSDVNVVKIRYRYLITKKQFYLRPAKARAIQISCYSVKHLLHDLNSIYLQIDKEYIEYALTSPLASDYDSAEDSDISDF